MKLLLAVVMVSGCSLYFSDEAPAPSKPDASAQPDVTADALSPDAAPANYGRWCTDTDRAAGICPHSCSELTPDVCMRPCTDTDLHAGYCIID